MHPNPFSTNALVCLRTIAHLVLSTMDIFSLARHSRRSIWHMKPASKQSRHIQSFDNTPQDPRPSLSWCSTCFVPEFLVVATILYWVVKIQASKIGSRHWNLGATDCHSCDCLVASYVAAITGTPSLVVTQGPTTRDASGVNSSLDDSVKST